VLGDNLGLGETKEQRAVQRWVLAVITICASTVLAPASAHEGSPPGTAPAAADLLSVGLVGDSIAKEAESGIVSLLE
jgi:hypothetical protein